MSEATTSNTTLRIQPLQIGIIALTGATAFLHVVVALSSGYPTHFPFPALYYLNAAGYLVLIFLLYLPRLHPYQRPIRWLLMLYVLMTIFAWVAFGERDPEGILDKGIECGLLVLLVLEEWQAIQQARHT